MELKLPVKKGYKTPRYRPPLPILNESSPGLCVEEYDWPLFNGYYNGTSIIVDDPRGIIILTNKGFFGKGSLSKGCPNLGKRKIPNNVVYESQWKRRKQWMENLNLLLKCKDFSNNAASSESKVDKEMGPEKVSDMKIKSFDVDAHVINSNFKDPQEEKMNKKEVSIGGNGRGTDPAILEPEKNQMESCNCDKKEDISGNFPQHSQNEDPPKDGIKDPQEEKINEKEVSIGGNGRGTDPANLEPEKNQMESCNCNKKEDISGNFPQHSQNEDPSKDRIKDPQEEKINEKEVSIGGNDRGTDPANLEPEKNQMESCNCDKKEDISGNFPQHSQNEDPSKDRIKDPQEEKINEKEVSIGGNDRGTGPANLEPEKNQMESCNYDKKEQISVPQNSQNEDPSEDTKITNLEIDVTSNQLVNEQSKRVIKICDSSYYADKGILKANEVLVISDIRNDLELYFKNLNPHIEEEKIKTAVEVLYLSLEEAFFLSYACNCLQISDLSTNILGIKEMWVLFQNSQVDFIEKYVAYHYFRAKGWVVKSGTKFGGDFLLYKKGPLYFHASYIVIVDVVKNDSNVKNKLTWQKINGMNRMAESATKEIIISHVIWPAVEKEKFSDPSILKEFSVSETLLRRWQATQEKNG